MCMILLSYRMNEKYPFILAANRDEFYERPSTPVSVWNDAPDIIAGKDLKSGGTWLGITKKGRFAAITNYRDPESFRENAPSRGWLVKDYLFGREDPRTYIEAITVNKNRYNGFSLILGDPSRLFYFSNRGAMRELSPGLYALSNGLLDTPWPKTERGKKALALLLSQRDNPLPEDMFLILSDRLKPDDIDLPDTGVGLEWERILSPIFITSSIYGTRSSSVIMIDKRDRVMFIERVFNGHPDPWMEVKFEFRIQGNKQTSQRK